VAFAENHRWKEPVPFKPFLYGEQERLSPDLKTLYFVSDQPRLDATPNANPGKDVPRKIWQISLEGWDVLGKYAVNQVGVDTATIPGHAH